MGEGAPEQHERPKAGRQLGEPSALVKFIVGFVVGVIIGVIAWYRLWALVPDDWRNSPSPVPMTLFVLFCGAVCGLLAGLFKRGPPRNP